MIVKKLNECGYEESAFGFSLSYNITIERAKELLPKYAFRDNGENKFLRSMQVWLDITAPRYWLTELDTYKIATVRLSESTMHTLYKKPVCQSDFEDYLPEGYIDTFNRVIDRYREGHITIHELKSALPEGFVQRISYNCSYATLQKIYIQRKNHRLPQWKYFIDVILKELDHPEFIKEDK